MRIGLLTTSFPHDSDGVSGSFVLGFARALAARGHRIDVLAPEPAAAELPVVEPHVTTTHVPYLRPRALSRTFYGAGVPDNLRRDPRAWLGLLPFPPALALGVARRRAAWDAIVSHWALPSALVAGLLREGRPHLCVFHSADLHLLCKLPLRAQLAERIARSASALWFVAPEQCDAFLSLLPERSRGMPLPRMIVSPMGIDPPSAPRASRDELRERLGLRRFTVLSLGRLVPIKGVDTAIAALARKDMTLLVAGDGIERERLERLARSEGGDVRMLGRVGPEARAELFAAADAFVMPSRTLANGRSEGVPTALLEAMAHGLPAVATQSGGMPSVIRHEVTGLLVPPEDPSALALALGRLRDDPALRARLAEAGRQAALSCVWPVLGQKAEAALLGLPHP